MRKTIKTGLLCLICLFSLWLLPISAKAAKPIDEITNYTITVDVNRDATLTITYHIEWLVLESKENGPVTWVEVGVPNKHIIRSKALSDNIKKMSLQASGDTTERIDFTKSYKQGETISFDFMIVQDYMYQMNQEKEGETVYEFTPGWFDEIPVDQFIIRWNSENVVKCSPNCQSEGGYYVWTGKLRPGGRYKVSVTYPNRAYQFDESKQIKTGGWGGSDLAVLIIVLIAIGAFLCCVIFCIISETSYNSTANLGSSAEQEIVRTKIEYYPTCLGCGRDRPEDSETCEYCGRSFVKSKTIIKEETVKKEDPNALKYKTDGLYPYTSAPNTFIYVRTQPALHAHTSNSRTRTATAHRSSSCAHSSCACACACACAGGGRAGCSTKDFYNTNLKLTQLEKKKRKF